MKFKITLIIFFLLVIGLFVKFYSYDCLTGECKSKLIFKSADYCEKWYIQEDISKLNCTYSFNNRDNLVFVADPANYIYGEETNDKIEYELLNVPLNWPWDIEFLPDGTFLITERSGKIVHSNGKTYFRYSLVNTEQDYTTGLLGLAIDPNFKNNNYIYVYYTVNKSSNNKSPDGSYKYFNRVSRFNFNKEFYNETIILDNIPGSGWHSGGRIEFGSDGFLYISTGDAGEVLQSSNLSVLSGKILRIDTKGNIPEDNPFYPSPIYTYGHRNPQGIVWNLNGEAYQVEHGNWRHDEINHLIKGKNYGWGYYQCDEKLFNGLNSSFNNLPIICFKNYTFAPSGMVLVDDPNSIWYGNIFVANLRGKHLHKYRFDNDLVLEDEIFYFSKYKIDQFDSRLRDVAYYNGSLYVIGNSKGLVKISPR